MLSFTCILHWHVYLLQKMFQNAGLACRFQGAIFSLRSGIIPPLTPFHKKILLPNASYMAKVKPAPLPAKEYWSSPFCRAASKKRLGTRRLLGSCVSHMWAKRLWVSYHLYPWFHLINHLINSDNYSIYHITLFKEFQ